MHARSLDRRCRLARLVAMGLGVLTSTSPADAQLFPTQNVNGAVPPYRYDVFPYHGQCTSNPSNAYPGAPPACPATIPPAPPIATGTVTPLNAALQPKWQWEVPNPVDYTPDTTTYPGAAYYELAIAPATNVQAAATLGVFPNPTLAPGAGQTAGAWVPDPAGIPQGTQWTGLVDPATKRPLYTPVWGFGQINGAGGPLAALAGSPGNNVNPVVVTWPSMNLRGTKGTPAIVKFVNQLPDNHLFCPHPLAWDWPCAVDRTLMGVKGNIDPVRSLAMPNVPVDAVNGFGSPQQPDNAFTIHLHGGEIPPQSDGFAEKWFGNANSGAAYSPTPQFLDPLFDAPPGSIGTILRPGGSPATSPFSAYDRMTYYYPMVNGESTIWFHDHALGKTRINVAAGPAGFAPIDDPAGQAAGGPYAWLNPLRVKNAAGIPIYDLFLAIQDRAFNNDGSINFPNGLGQPVPQPPLVVGTTPVTPGSNPRVHPQWVGEYFADHITVNGVIWPKVTVARGVYRLRLLNGSNARCYQLGLGTKEPMYATATAGGSVTRNVGFTVIADEQGYLPKPVAIPSTGFLQMCPGERYEILVDFSLFPVGASVFMSNVAPAPFPVGITPQQKGSVFAQTASILRFNVGTAPGIVITPPASTNPTFTDLRTTPPPPCSATVTTDCLSATRQLYLNERLDPTTLASLGLQINGVPFEYAVSETPRQGTYERWQIINTTADYHPMHLHLVKLQVVSRQSFSVAGYTRALCGLSRCTIFGGGAGGMMQVVPDVTPFLSTATLPTPPGAHEAGWKDTVQAPPGTVTTVIARWDGGWKQPGVAAADPRACAAMNFPGVDSYVAGATYNPAQPLCFEPVTNAPYVWHCHIVDHEDAEMMRSSLVMK